jgi:hypothetical protein
MVKMVKMMVMMEMMEMVKMVKKCEGAPQVRTQVHVAEEMEG